MRDAGFTLSHLACRGGGTALHRAAWGLPRRSAPGGPAPPPGRAGGRRGGRRDSPGGRGRPLRTPAAFAVPSRGRSAAVGRLAFGLARSRCWALGGARPPPSGGRRRREGGGVSAAAGRCRCAIARAAAGAFLGARRGRRRLRAVK